MGTAPLLIVVKPCSVFARPRIEGLHRPSTLCVFVFEAVMVLQKMFKLHYDGWKRRRTKDFPRRNTIWVFVFRDGIDVPKDSGKAAKWFPLAAEQGYAKAQHNLGVLFMFGDGVARDVVEAVKWFRLAAEQGFRDAQHSLGNAYYRGKGVTQDFHVAVKWYQLAVAQGYSSAQYCLGICFVNGHGVVKDTAKGVEWLRKAAAHGPADEGGAAAIDALKRLGMPLK